MSYIVRYYDDFGEIQEREMTEVGGNPRKKVDRTEVVWGLMSRGFQYIEGNMIVVIPVHQITSIRYKL